MTAVSARVRRALRSLLSPAPAPSGGVSNDYAPIAPADVAGTAARLASAWQDPAIPSAQLAVAEDELRRYARRERVPVFDTFVSLLGEIPAPRRRTVLEVGCASGYYGDVLRLAMPEARYAGCDYSQPLIDVARRRLPDVDFRIADATRLGYADASYDVVVSGCCILHIANYAVAIREAARVARHYVLFHRTPVLHLTPTTHYRKRAYGVECVETHFNEAELCRLFAASGLRVAHVATVDVGAHSPVGDVQLTKSYLCVKAGDA